MQLDALDIDKFVAVNKLQQVTTLSFFESTGAPTDGGLFSTRIFGRAGSPERSTRWAYIELNGRFMHPLVYKTCTQLDRKFTEIITMSRYVRVTKTGELATAEEGEPGSFTGLDALYENWEKIKWGDAKKGSQRWERVSMLRAIPRDSAFVTKWHVIPAAYRDVDINSSSMVRDIPVVNGLYTQLMVSAPTTVSGLVFADGFRKRRAQEALLEIYQWMLDPVSGKKGLIQDRVLGKYTDYAVRGVISAPPLAKANHPSEQEVPFGTVGVPLYLLVNMYQPFVIKRLNEIFAIYTSGQERVLVADNSGNTSFIEIPDEARVQLGAELYRKWISRFMRSQTNRFDKLSVTTARGEEFPIPLYDRWLGRPTLLIDLFFIVVAEVIVDKYAVFTRYPVEDFRACHFFKPVIITTEKTKTQLIGNAEYKNYPDLKHRSLRWVDSIRINNSYTAAAGADYDGDTIRIIGLFTQEANKEAAEKIKQATNFADGQGNFSRNLGNEAVLSLYSLTK